MNKRIIIITIFLIIINIFYSYSADFDIVGKVESLRKDKKMTLLFEEKPVSEKYLIIEDNSETGKITILDIIPFTKNGRKFYRAIAEYSLTGKLDIIKTGSVIALSKAEDKEINPLMDEPKVTGKTNYKQYIVTDIDNREMIFIPGGKFLFGSDEGNKDERPKQIINIDDFYIDKFEVSNSDYFVFVRKTNSKPPASWTSGEYNKGEDDFPVIVSYYEAVKYAEWARKRLPLEEEWEKAARGSGLELKKLADESFIYIEKPVLYPWGNKFDPSKANSIDFWENNNIGKDIKNKYKKGYLPVYFFKGSGDSIYGAVNMSGNAAEWTDSWYSAYAGSKYSNKMFGKQVKVIRGGAWYNSKNKLRGSDREPGGLPNLYDDNIAGFRCARDTTIVDEIK